MARNCNVADRATSALMSLSADCARSEWVRIAAAAKAAGIEFDLFNQWSATSPNRYDARATADLWRSLNADGGITANTLFHLAREQGRLSETPIKAKRSEKIDVEKLWANGGSAEGHHYIIRKSGTAEGLRVYRGALRIAGEAMDGWLMVPARTGEGHLQSLQFISPTSGRKLNLPGAVLGGALHIVGELRADAPAFVVEGIGAAWTVHSITGACAVVTFGSGNTARVAEVIRGRVSRLVLVADRGKEREREADAARLGCSWVELPESLAAGCDINDLAANEGPDVARIALATERSKGSQAVSGFEFRSVSDLLSDGLKPISWLVRDYVEADSLALIFGDPGAGKSFVAIDLACCVATGTPWHGRETTQGAVFYIAGEGLNGLARRFAAWAKHNHVGLNGKPLFVSGKAARLCDCSEAASVSEAVDRLASTTGASPSLIVIDTLARNFGGADENSAQDMGAFIANLDAFLRCRYRASVLVVHHSGHGDKSRARGSTALKGAVDTEFAVSKDPEGTVRFEATKMKDAEQPAPLAFRMEPVELGTLEMKGLALSLVEYSTAAKAGKAGKGRHQVAALRVLREAIERHRSNVFKSGRDPETASVRYEVWRDLCNETGIDRRRFSEVVQSLKNVGRIRVENGHVEVSEAFL